MWCSIDWRKAATAAVLGLLVGFGAGRETVQADGRGAAAVADRKLCVHGVSGSGLNVRAGPGLDKAIIAKFARDDCELQLVGKCADGWCEMARGDTRGWVDTRYVGVYETPRADASAPRSRAASRRTDRRSHAQQRRIAPQPAWSAADEHRKVVRSAPSLHFWPFGGVIRMALGAFVPPSPRAHSCVARVAHWDTLRIRSGPGTAYPRTGDLPSDACHVEQAGPCRGQWCRVSWRGRVGWVNTFYLE